MSIIRRQRPDPVNPGLLPGIIPIGQHTNIGHKIERVNHPAVSLETVAAFAGCPVQAMRFLEYSRPVLNVNPPALNVTSVMEYLQ